MKCKVAFELYHKIILNKLMVYHCESYCGIQVKTMVLLAEKLIGYQSCYKFDQQVINLQQL